MNLPCQVLICFCFSHSGSVVFFSLISHESSFETYSASARWEIKTFLIAILSLRAKKNLLFDVTHLSFALFRSLSLYLLAFSSFNWNYSHRLIWSCLISNQSMQLRVAFYTHKIPCIKYIHIIYSLSHSMENIWVPTKWIQYEARKQCLISKLCVSIKLAIFLFFSSSFSFCS